MITHPGLGRQHLCANPGISRLCLRVALRDQFDHRKQHHIAVVLPLELAGQVSQRCAVIHTRAEFRAPFLFHRAPVQQRQVRRDKGRAAAGLYETPEHGPRHAQLQARERNEIAQSFG